MHTIIKGAAALALFTAAKHVASKSEVKLKIERELGKALVGKDLVAASHAVSEATSFMSSFETLDLTKPGSFVNMGRRVVNDGFRYAVRLQRQQQTVKESPACPESQSVKWIAASLPDLMAVVNSFVRGKGCNIVGHISMSNNSKMGSMSSGCFWRDRSLRARAPIMDMLFALVYASDADVGSLSMMPSSNITELKTYTLAQGGCLQAVWDPPEGDGAVFWFVFAKPQGELGKLALEREQEKIPILFDGPTDSHITTALDLWKELTRDFRALSELVARSALAKTAQGLAAGSPTFQFHGAISVFGLRKEQEQGHHEDGKAFDVCVRSMVKPAVFTTIDIKPQLDRLRMYMIKKKPRKVLFQGTPGTGKTFMALWIAEELDLIPVICTLGMLKPVIRSCEALFEPGSYCIICDDIDRSDASSDPSMLNCLEVYGGWLLMTSNNLRQLPAAFRRPGRLTNVVVVPPPSMAAVHDVVTRRLEALSHDEQPCDDVIKWFYTIARSGSYAALGEALTRFRVEGRGVLESHGDITFDQPSSLDPNEIYVRKEAAGHEGDHLSERDLNEIAESLHILSGFVSGLG